MAETAEQAMGRVRQGTARRKVTRALAYDVWRYVCPNEEALESASAHIDRVQNAAKIAGYRLVFEKIEPAGAGLDRGKVANDDS